MKPYSELTKLYLDIETTGLNPDVDRVIMVGLMNAQGEQTIISDEDEQVILKKTFSHLKKNKPDVLIGHNLFNFDIPFLAKRCRINRVRHPFRKSKQIKRISSSSHHGKPIEFTPIYWSGVDIVDTYHQVAIWDKQAAKLSSYGLKASTIALGLRDEKRLELSNEQIQDCWRSRDLETIEQYLGFDLEDTKLLADFLLPVVWYQMAYVPKLNFQELAIASPALKAQKIHQNLIKGESVSDEQARYEGAKIELVSPGLHHNVAKIDVSSLYPSIMLRYGVCSRKDTDHEFLGVLNFMTQERLRLKGLAKQGDKAAKFQEKALKVLINGSYGFMGTGGYTFNDYEAASLVTAYGRKILTLMMDTVSNLGATIIEVDTDGILFSHESPEDVTRQVQAVLPDGINIELELQNCGIYAPKAKSYVIVYPDGKTTVKGLFRKRDRYPLEREFPVEFIRLWFTHSPDIARDYYRKVRIAISNREMPVEKLTVTRKISSNETRLINLGLGKAGDRVSYWFTSQSNVGKNGSFLGLARLETQSQPYWIDYYLGELDQSYRDITGEAFDIGTLPIFQQTA